MDIHDYLRQKGLADEEGLLASEDKCVREYPEPDMVNHPPHYTSSNGIECIDAIEACIEYYGNPSHAGLVWQVVKYLWRAPLKNNYEQDIHKAQFYLNRLVAKLDGN